MTKTPLPMRLKPKSNIIEKYINADSNNYQTPGWVVDSLIPYLKKKWMIWECTAGDGNLANRLKQKGFMVIESDIRPRDKSVIYYDFIGNTKFLLDLDCVITNPPFFFKNEFLEKCYELKKPFALLLPLTALESERRQSLYREHGLEIILFNKRINFILPDLDKKSCWFSTAWFTYGLNIGKQLTFVKI